MLKNSQKPFSENNNSYKILIVGDSKSEDLYVGLMTSSLGKKYEIRRIHIDYPTVKNPIKNKFGYKNNLFNDADEGVLASTWQIYTPFQYKSDHVAFMLWLIENGKKVSLVSTSNFNHVASLSYFIAKNELEGFKASNYIYRNIRNDLRTQFKSLKQSVNKKTNEVRSLKSYPLFAY